MNTTLDYLRSNRKFLVKDFAVYGDYTAAEGGALYTEALPGNARVMFSHSYLSEDEQAVDFNQLYDYRGNQLPETLTSPKVIIMPKNEVQCFLVGSENESGFKIAKHNPGKTGLVDLLIMEME
ncbi:MAG: hypothetical protein GF307_11755 [candidate division Zixibacteria bacterium]|nr:hypothetical protein [candidate division Zixibacteria bacterium]